MAFIKGNLFLPLALEVRRYDAGLALMVLLCSSRFAVARQGDGATSQDGRKENQLVRCYGSG